MSFKDELHDVELAVRRRSLQSSETPTWLRPSVLTQHSMVAKTRLCSFCVWVGATTREELYRQFYVHRHKMGDPTSMRRPEEVFGTEGSGMVRFGLTRNNFVLVWLVFGSVKDTDCSVGVRILFEHFVEMVARDALDTGHPGEGFLPRS